MATQSVEKYFPSKHSEQMKYFMFPLKPHLGYLIGFYRYIINNVIIIIIITMSVKCRHLELIIIGNNLILIE